MSVQQINVLNITTPVNFVAILTTFMINLVEKLSVLCNYGIDSIKKVCFILVEASKAMYINILPVEDVEEKEVSVDNTSEIEKHLSRHDEATKELLKLKALWGENIEAFEFKHFLKEKSRLKRPKIDHKIRWCFDYLIKICNPSQFTNGKFDGTHLGKNNRKSVTQFYNMSVNYLKSITKEDCFIHDLMKRDENGNLILFRVGKEKERECAMFQTSLSIEEQKQKLPALKTLPFDQIKGKGRKVFLEKDEVWDCIMAAIDNVDLKHSSLIYEKVPIKRLLNGTKASTKASRIILYNELGTFTACGMSFVLKIPMPYDTYILSNSNWIKQYGSGWQHTNYHPNLQCSRYEAFIEKVHAKIFELSNRLYNDNNFPYMSVTCVRQEPNVCGHVTMCKKPLNDTYVTEDGAVIIANAVKCSSCQMELCNGGCGRASHGGTCTMTSDEASDATIASTTKICPHCQNPVEKSEGCNHIHCQCGGHFCWSCNQAYDLNDVTDHYGRGRCRQFD